MSTITKFMRDGVDITNVPFVDGEGVSYVAGWPKGATDEQLAALGITKVVESVQPPPLVIVPSAVTMRQARLALLAAGKLSLVDAAINGLSEPEKTAAKITWEYSTEVQRHNGLVSQVAPALGLTEAQIDALFIQAATL